jgi:hypothetical protein
MNFGGSSNNSNTNSSSTQSSNTEATTNSVINLSAFGTPAQTKKTKSNSESKSTEQANTTTSSTSTASSSSTTPQQNSSTKTTEKTTPTTSQTSITKTKKATATTKSTTSSTAKKPTPGTITYINNTPYDVAVALPHNSNSYGSIENFNANNLKGFTTIPPMKNNQPGKLTKSAPKDGRYFKIFAYASAKQGDLLFCANSAADSLKASNSCLKKNSSKDCTLKLVPVYQSANDYTVTFNTSKNKQTSVTCSVQQDSTSQQTQQQ